jgi:hypothetical protein
MSSTFGIAVLASLLAAASGCVVAAPSDRPPGIRTPPGGGSSIGDIDPALVGCWDWYNYRDARTGTASYRGRLELYEEGVFDWRAYPWASSEGKGLPEYNEQGDWGVRGNDLDLYAVDGPVVRRAISFVGDGLYLDGVKQFTCL